MGYWPKQAQEKAHKKHQNRLRFRKLTAAIQLLISENMKLDWSPEQMLGRLRSEGLPMVCATTIYRYIQQDKVSGGSL